MLRRAASTLNGHAAAWLRRPPRRPATPPPSAQLGTHHPRARAHLQPRRELPHPGGARGYRRMARRVPPARPDGYSSSDGEVEDEPDECAEIPSSGDEGEEGTEVDGYMINFGQLFEDLEKGKLFEDLAKGKKPADGEEGGK